MAMSKPKYCWHCNEALTSETGYATEGAGMFTTRYATLYYCENVACPRYGLLSRMALIQKRSPETLPNNNGSQSKEAPDVTPE